MSSCLSSWLPRGLTSLAQAPQLTALTCRHVHLGPCRGGVGKDHGHRDPLDGAARGPSLRGHLHLGHTFCSQGLPPPGLPLFFFRFPFSPFRFALLLGVPHNIPLSSFLCCLFTCLSSIICLPACLSNDLCSCCYYLEGEEKAMGASWSAI